MSKGSSQSSQSMYILLFFFKYDKCLILVSCRTVQYISKRCSCVTSFTSVSLLSDSECIPTQEETSLGVVKYNSVTESLSKISTKRGRYKTYSDDDRYEIGLYAALHGPMSAVKKYKKKHPQLGESTVRTFRDKYHKSLKASHEKTSISWKTTSPWNIR